MVTGGPLARLPNAWGLFRSSYPHPSPEAPLFAAQSVGDRNGE